MKKIIKTLFVSSFAFLPLVLSGCNFEFKPEGEGEQEATPEPEDDTVQVLGVSLNKDTMPLTVGGTGLLVATISPAKATNKNVTWTSSNEEVATVDEGLVTAVALGKATITVLTEDGNLTATCEVTVQEQEIKVTGVELNYEEYTLELGKSVRLVESVSPNTATNQNVTWSSSDEAVVTVENGNITAVAEGEATITVTTVDGGFTATCVVTVIEEENTDPYIPEEDDLYIHITEAGTYALSGEINKQVYVDAPGAEVELSLEGATITYGENSPIYVKECDSIDISAKKKTTNIINDTRSVITVEDDNQGKGAIYVADGDLKLKGTGSLTINAGYNNGVHGKDDVKVQKLTLGITAPNHAIKANDSFTMTSGDVSLSCGGDGIKTENTDISSKGNQRGNVSIEGGSLVINSYGDGISAAYNAVITETPDETGAVEFPTSVTIKTDKYSSYSGQTAEVEESKFYLKLSSSLYQTYGSTYTFAAYINGQFYKAEYAGTQKTSSSGWRPGPGGGGGGQPGGTTTYYIYEIEKPENATSFTLYLYKGANLDEFSTSTYYAKSETKTFNSAYDLITINYIQSSTITFGSWATYVDSPSTKGIKAENQISVEAGTLNITSLDDGLHTNNDASLENGEKPLGNVVISGGSTTISSDDDGVHADGTLNISGGELSVTKSYEGIEGNIIAISGGATYVVASDDGVNASSGNSTPAINISGGYLDVTVSPSGDTDGIDSNGTYTQTGGVVIARGPNSTNMAALDTDSTCRIDGGTIIVLGALGERGLTRGSGVNSYSLSLHSSGNHTVTIDGESLTFSNKYSYGRTICYSSVSVK